ncbi:MAG TPA: YbaY family lipoprotein [Xanthomonadales bacterium]|nr:YbaY family lipoprotein [Xanthomonadales bacterium]
MRWRYLLLTSAWLLQACDTNIQSASVSAMDDKVSMITGTVSYRERILLRPGSRLEIVLEDVSRADAPALAISRTERVDPGQVPIAFELEYRPADINPAMSYAIRARILAPDGSLLFINDTHTPVITRDAGTHVDMLLVSAQRKVATGEPAAAGDEDAGMELRGQFSYLADAALFRDCNTGKTFPVEMSGQYLELERAYLNSGIKAGENLTVSLRGRYLERPDTESNANKVKLIVDTFHSISDNQDCTPTHHAELTGTFWKLVELNGKPILQSKDSNQQRMAHIVLQQQELRVKGNGGCNSFFGSYTHDGEKLAFSGLGSTMMACPDGMETEQAFLLALGETNRAVVSGQFLELFKDDHSLARFEAIYF